MNYFERFRALNDVMEQYDLDWDDLMDAGFSRGMYSELEAVHNQLVANGKAVSDPEAFEANRKEFILRFVR